MEENGQLTERTEAGSGRKKYSLHIISVIVYVSIAVYGEFNIAIGQPGVGSWWLILLVFALPPLLHHMVMIALLASGVDAKKKRYSIPVRIITLVLGILLVGPLNSYAAAYAMQRFTSSQREFVTSLHRPDVDICARAVQYKRTQTGSTLSGLWYKDGDYVVTYYGGSIDIDGSTIYYQQHTRKWNIVHNDRLQQEGDNHPLNKLMAEMNACDIRVN